VTFSIVARSRQAALFGVGLASSSPAVGARCAHARAGVGAVATQNSTDPALGPLILGALERNGAAGAAAAIDAALQTTAHAAYRQLAVVGRTGVPAVHCGARALGVVGAAIGANAAAAGNLLADSSIPAAMIEAFDAEPALDPEPAFEAESAAVAGFCRRLLAALRRGAECGGEAGPIHSAGLLIVRDLSWPLVDLRVDWADHDPIGALTRVWNIYAPQIEDYVRRAQAPDRAPSFGVAGDP
jgi:uncharacterized Ntn-hydrolase superfamily protein